MSKRIKTSEIFALGFYLILALGFVAGILLLQYGMNFDCGSGICTSYYVLLALVLLSLIIVFIIYDKKFNFGVWLLLVIVIFAFAVLVDEKTRVTSVTFPDDHCWSCNVTEKNIKCICEGKEMIFSNQIVISSIIDKIQANCGSTQITKASWLGDSWYVFKKVIMTGEDGYTYIPLEDCLK